MTTTTKEKPIKTPVGICPYVNAIESIKKRKRSRSRSRSSSRSSSKLVKEAWAETPRIEASPKVATDVQHIRKRVKTPKGKEYNEAIIAAIRGGKRKTRKHK